MNGRSCSRGEAHARISQMFEVKGAKQIGEVKDTRKDYTHGIGNRWKVGP